jgi:hypothetical protein
MPSELPHGWSRPERNLQTELFSEDANKVLALTGVSWDEVEAWHAAGWLSFEPFVLYFEHAQIDELCFVRNLVHSPLSEEAMEALLEELEPPYRYDPVRTVYSFADGWVVPPVGFDELFGDAEVTAAVLQWARSRFAVGEGVVVEGLLRELHRLGVEHGDGA